MFSIDGIDWDVYCEISRVSEMRASEISGLMLDKSYFNDVIGTWLKYDVSIVVPYGKESDYYALYEAITKPVGAHTFVFPYNNALVTVVGRVDSISDIYEKMPGGGSYWRGIKFTAISNHPMKKVELDEVITMGIPPLPPEVSVSIGEVYEYTSTGWTQLANAEDNYY